MIYGVHLHGVVRSMTPMAGSPASEVFSNPLMGSTIVWQYYGNFILANCFLFIFFCRAMDSTYTRRRVGFACAARAAIHAIIHHNRRKPQSPRIASEYDATKIATSFLHGSNKTFKTAFRLRKPEFHRLVQWLQNNASLEESRDISAEQKVMVVLRILGLGEVQRITANRMGLSQTTVSRIVDELLPMLEDLHRAFVRLPDDDWLDPDIELDPKLNAFNGCIGAIDGTHISAHIPTKQQLRWRDRKSRISQNVFAAVRSDLSFSYVLAGAEGSTADASLFSQALGRSFRVPQDRYYIGDAGFGARDGIVVPFPGVRYHLEDHRNAKRKPQTKKELYNLRHARIRVVVERAFGHLKRRWKIVRIAPPEYGIEKQVQIVYAVTGLHNFLLSEAREDELTRKQVRLMSLAKSRARRVVRGQHPDDIRLQTAHETWENWKRWQRRNPTGRLRRRR